MATEVNFELDKLLNIGCDYQVLKKLLEHLLKKGIESDDQITKLRTLMEETQKELKMYSSKCIINEIV